ncbi:MAG: hypothetical protein EBZ60_08860, partial [Betaproteobacteria bacterium]|nr:hypothetical protein [Betaproteobacteria bacterium]
MLVAARNRCVGQFMDDTKATHMLFLDADISVRWEDVMVALVADKDVVAIPCLKRAIEASDGTLESVLLKARFWEKHIHQPFNERQRTLINRLLDGSFEGRLTSSKWAKMSRCSGDTA